VIAKEMFRRIQQRAELGLQVIVQEGRGFHKKVIVGSCRPRSRSIAARISARAARSDPKRPRAVSERKMAAMTGGPYRASIVRDEDGYWFVDFPDVPGCHTQGRTLRAARQRMRDALSLFVNDADSAEIVEDLHLPGDALAAVRRTTELREQAAQVQQESQAAARAAVRSLLDAGLTLRDAGDVLGMSFQRVHQLAS
jgi:predicted RNase H-like HicB family nuclease